MKNLILSLVAVGFIGFLTGCADDTCTKTDTNSASMSYDSKDMHPRHHHTADNQ